jgi:A nuclease of the HNH/ENDO VII superfamily with conserved LHH
MASASVVDTQLSDMVAGSESCGEHAVKRAREYAAAAHFIGLLAGVVGNSDEIAEARATVKEALAGIGFSAADDALRRDSLVKAAEWKALSDTPTAGMSPEQRAAHLAKTAEAMEAWNQAAKPLAEKWSPQGIANRLWGSLKQIYNDAIKFVREDMWKLSACKLSVDAGFFILENGLAVALAAAGMAAAAAVLKIVAIVGRGARFARVSVIATRGLAGGAAARNPGKMFAEKTFKRDIDTGAVSNDAKKFLDESGQGTKTPDRSPAKGEEGGGGQRKYRDAKQVAGRKVYQRDDLINPNYVDKNTGLTNKQLMEAGQAPYGPDGRQINLHHVTQTEPGPMAEVLGSTHSENHRLLHTYANQHDKYWRDKDGVKRQYQSAPESMDRGPFNKWKKEYWKTRAIDF